jgi:hypothetical protein
MTNGGEQDTSPRYAKNSTGTQVKALLPLAILLLAGCGVDETSTGPYTTTTTQGGGGGSDSGGGGGSTPSPPPTGGVTVNPTGIWDISGTVNGKTVSEIALIAGGKFYSLATGDPFGCGSLTGGTYAIDGSTFTGTGVSALFSNCTGPNAQSYLTYTLSGYMTGSDLNLSFDFDGLLLPALGAAPDPLYNEPSSLTKLTGNWDDNGNTLTIDPDGTFFEQQASGCVVNGTYSIIDATHNLYAVSFEITNCSSSVAGIAFTGLGYLDDSDPNAWHFIEDVSGPNPADGNATVVVFDNITPM